MHIYRYPIVALILAISFCAKQPAAKQSAEEKDWAVELSRGYVKHTKQPLLDFLNNWHSKSKPVSPKVVKKKPEFERAVYDLYPTFFKPVEKYYKNTQYIVIQDKINVHIVESDLSRVFDANPGIGKTWSTNSRKSAILCAKTFGQKSNWMAKNCCILTRIAWKRCWASSPKTMDTA